MAVFEINLFSNSLHRQTQVTAILPVEEIEIPGFPKLDKSKPFRSIYLLHGFSGGHGDWLRGSRIEELAMLYNVAVFCPSGENSFYLDDTVRDAYYEQYLCKELVDFTRRVFPISGEPKDTSIGGLSMGGYGALRNGLKHSDVFGNIVALSSALITDGLEFITQQPDNPIASPSYYIHTFGKPEAVRGSDVDPKALAKKVLDNGGPIPNIYMACGAEDFLITENRSLDAHLTDIGFPHVYVEGPGIHSWAFWDAYIEKALMWLNGLSGQ
jgi:S-formylglutathione hydrolase FrmB